jgi:hypothetical protein
MTSRQAGSLQSGAPKRDSGRITGVSQVKAMGGRTVMRDGQEVTIYHPRSGKRKGKREPSRFESEASGLLSEAT